MTADPAANLVEAETVRKHLHGPAPAGFQAIQ